MGNSNDNSDDHDDHSDQKKRTSPLDFIKFVIDSAIQAGADGSASDSTRDEEDRQIKRMILAATANEESGKSFGVALSVVMPGTYTEAPFASSAPRAILAILSGPARDEPFAGISHADKAKAADIISALPMDGPTTFALGVNPLRAQKMAASVGLALLDVTKGAETDEGCGCPGCRTERGAAGASSVASGAGDETGKKVVH